MPSIVHIERNGTVTDVNIKELKKDDIAVIKPGEKIPADGAVTEGSSYVNESVLTGESVPVKKEIEAKVIAGAINGDGSLKIKVTGTGEDSYYHESGTLWMGDNAATSVTDEFGKIWETDNLYIVGPALLPTMGSPNPMLSGVALARRTADHLVPVSVAPLPETGFKHLFDGTEKTFQQWRGAGEAGGSNYFALINGLLVAQPIGDLCSFLLCIRKI